MQHPPEEKENPDSRQEATIGCPFTLLLISLPPFQIKKRGRRVTFPLLLVYSGIYACPFPPLFLASLWILLPPILFMPPPQAHAQPVFLLSLIYGRRNAHLSTFIRLLLLN